MMGDPFGGTTSEDAMTTAEKTVARSGPDDAALLRELADALRRVKRGDLKVRLPRRAGTAGEVADAFNEVVALQERQNLDVRKISRIVGRDGRLTERLDEEGLDGAWVDGARAVNSLIDDLGRPTTEISRVIVAVAEGDLSQHMALEMDGRPLRGEFLRIGRTVNTMVDQLSSFSNEVTRVAREVGTEGALGGQADVRALPARWRTRSTRWCHCRSGRTSTSAGSAGSWVATAASPSASTRRASTAPGRTAPGRSTR